MSAAITVVIIIEIAATTVDKIGKENIIIMKIEILITGTIIIREELSIAITEIIQIADPRVEKGITIDKVTIIPTADRLVEKEIITDLSNIIVLLVEFVLIVEEVQVYELLVHTSLLLQNLLMKN